MKPKAHLRIVCLKNTLSSKSYHNHKSFSASRNSRHNIPTENAVVPNLVYLSARLQEVQKYNQESRISSVNKKNQLFEQEVNTQIKERKEISLRQIDEKQLTIQKYFQKNREKIQKQKNTIRNMMGAIEFSSDKKKQRKISKNIKHTLLKDEISHRLHRKRNYEEQVVKNSVNRTYLQEDFKNFLHNKQIEYNNPKIIDLKQEENRKLRKLTIVNPEKQKLRQLKNSSRSLNLFNFLSNKNESKLNSPFKQSNSFRVEPMSSDLRLEKKIMKLALNLKTQQQDFDWKKFQADKGFNLTTINS